MSDSGDPNGKDAAYWRRQPETEKTLRQFLKMESGAYTRPSFRHNYEQSMHDPQPLVRPAPCGHCDYIATTDAEIHWHEERNPGHDCCPDNVAKVVELCRECGNPLKSGHFCETANCPLLNHAQNIGK